MKEIVKREWFLSEDKNTEDKIRALLKENAELKQGLDELKKNYEKLNNSRNLYIGNVSHEIRTPLNSIIGFSDYLVKKFQDGPYVNYLNIINSSSRDLLKVIEDVLDLTNIEMGRFELKKSHFSLKDLFFRVEDKIKRDLSSKNLDLNVDLPGEEVDLNVDYPRLIRVLSSFSLYAIDFAQLNAEVKIKVEFEESCNL